MASEELNTFCRDPIVSAHIESFMEAHCSIFTCEEEIHSEHYTIHKSFSEMMKSLLNNSPINYNRIQEVHATYKITEDDIVTLNSVCYIIACWNFKLFYHIMTLMNVELQLEALRYIQQMHENNSMYVLLYDDNNDSLNNSTQINQNEINEMLVEKSQQKYGMMKISCNTPNKQLTNLIIPSKIKRDHLSTNTVTSSSSSSSNQLLNGSDLHSNESIQHKLTKNEFIIEKQAFLRKQRDLLIEMRRKQREQLFHNHVQSITDNNLKCNNVNNTTHLVDKQHDEIMEKRRKLYEKLKIEVINKWDINNK
ncbi:Leucine-rich repeat serine/threonine-protein kinase 1 [Schistosoma japonicum]|nr:Leucine-rich repeat serine/threonine-protein kinase 1 [Schistosoma japonicum]